jgi:NodT family efflux transporter outer membrane factor (OMF) lipoprotein
MAGLFGLMVFSGCTAVGPDFQAPNADVPAAWTHPALAGAAASASAATVDLARWWTGFHDPVLASLVQRAVDANLGLKQAEARLRQARASRRVAAAGYGPTLDTTGSSRHSRGAGTPGGDGRPDASNQYQAGFDASWELDLFGGTRRAVEAADADVQASEDARRDVLVTLVADVARGYVELRTSQQRLEIAKANLAAQQRSVELTRRRQQQGFTSGLDLANAEAQVATTSAQIPAMETSVLQAIHGLSVLLAREPGALAVELSTTAAIPVAPPDVPAGVPSDLLRRRPDIRQAEAGIHAATARIGVATADLYPKFSISGAIGRQAVHTGDLLDPVSRFWSLGPSVSWSLFDSGRVRSQVELEKALQEQSVLAYRQTVLTALQEVEDALVAAAKEQERRRALTDAVTASRKAVELSTALYGAGETDFLSALIAQRALLAAEDALVQSTGTTSTQLIALYKALGGGWEAR